MLNDDTIVALTTAPMESAIAVIRISGENSFSIGKRIFSKNLDNLKIKHAYFTNIVDDNKKIIDEVIAIFYQAPYSFTGENVVEIMVHGGLIIIRKVIELIISLGARLATKGEFSKRAYLNNKITLMQAEAIHDLIFAKNEISSDLAIKNLKGDTSKLIGTLKEELLFILANIEVNIDYPEYDDMQILTADLILPKIETLINKIDEIIKLSKKGQIIVNGINAAIIGSPNSGKSTLLNSLLKEEKAIVSNIAGTTRDIVEGKINIGGITLNLLDTAGIRKSTNKIEQIGISKSKEIIKKAELVLLIIDGSKKIKEEDLDLIELTKKSNRIIVINKTDLNINRYFQNSENLFINECVFISAKNNNISTLEQKIIEKIGFTDFQYEDQPLISNIRHIGLLKETLKNLHDAHLQATNNNSIDLISVDLQLAYENIVEIQGNKLKESLLDEIFSKFCLGK